MTDLSDNLVGAKFVLRKPREAPLSGPKFRFSRFQAIIGIVLFALGFCSGMPSYGASGRETKRVLILYSFDKDEDFFYQFDRTLRSKLQSESPDRIEFYTEFLDLVRFPSKRHEELLDKLLNLKLSEQKPDLIIPVSYPALNFMLETGKDLFPETPIVFSCVGDSFANELKNSIARAGRHSVGGVLLRNQQGDSLKLAFQLQPDTQGVVAVAGATPLEKYWVAELEKELAQIRPGIKFTYLSDLPMDEILKKVAVLPPHTIIFYPYFFLDGTGRFFTPEEALDLISGAADAPVYGSFRSYIGHGLVGGQMLDYEDVAVITAEVASRALRGEQAADPQVTVETKSNTTVDWRELQHWNISESRVPPGTIVLFKETSLFERYRWYILGVFAICTCEAILILALLIQGARRKRAEEALRESEERFRLVADTAPALIWMSGGDKLCTFFNKGWLNFTGRSMEQELGEGWTTGVHPDDLEQCLGIYSAAFDARVDFEMEYRLRRFDGEYRWIVDYGVTRFGADGTFCGYIGSCVDITDRRLSEASLQELSGRLIHAQEEERARIARELHDDLSQRMALLSIGLEQFEQGMPGLSSKARQQLHNIAEVTRELSSDIHNMSHQLHPSKLDTLGLVPAVWGLCKELSKQHELQIKFVHDDVPSQIPKDVTLCLFRIVQEALRNVVKHSGAMEAKLELSSKADEIDLCVSDPGRGFDPEAVKGEAGLGLISMRERLRLVGGHLSVESKPSHGTRIRVRIPLSSTSAHVTSEQKQHEASV
jgi:PAS domain S-box-containing protein